MNSLIIATGTNQGNKKENLTLAKLALSKFLNLISESQIYKSEAVDYLDQPDFYNQCLEFEVPITAPQQLMKQLLDVEQEMGRTRDIDKGPRVIDIDIIFLAKLELNTQDLTIPHYAWSNRSFVVRPLHDLSCYQSIQKWFKIPSEFDVEAYPINN
jgi:2-amino-4-hydroxy-6-hydroxymethyldihydropteridine diphosphokinase